MKQTIKLFLVLLLLQYGGVIYGQSNPVEGLWMIENVKFGNREMTPVAKWTRINPGGTYESGNGWLKNSEGTWTFNKESGSFLAKETNGLTDPFGAFTVSFEGNKMKWERTEEEQKVTVTLILLNEIPESPADKIKGLWDLDRANQDDKDITQKYDPDNKRYIFIRWDRIYVERTSEGKRQTGYWYMNAHRPEITLMSHNAKQKPLSWKVEFINDKKMSMTGISDSNKGQLLIYNRLTSFPE